MKNMFEPERASEVKHRLARLTPESARQWGTMSVAQALAHCTAGVKMAAGEIRPQRALIGRILGPIIKPLALGNDNPIRRNSPTAKDLVVADARDFETERNRLYECIDRFAAAGPDGCTTHPHAFFGRLTPEQWATLMYKHLDHHLRQFGA